MNSTDAEENCLISGKLMLFMNLEKYDSVRREALYNNLSEFGIPTN
jgi:hypothetical protein